MHPDYQKQRLSRWAKPVRIVPNSEVAAHIYNTVKDHISVMPSNVVTPQVRAEMEKLGMEFVETNNNGKFVDGVHKGQTWTSVYGKQAKKKKKQKAPTREDNTRKMDERAMELVKEFYDENIYGCADPATGMIYIFPHKQSTIEDVESSWWHESTHVAWYDIDMEDKEECGRATLEYLRKNDIYHYDMIMRGKYPEYKWAEEAACRLVQHIIENYGVESFLTSNMSGDNKKVAKLAAVLQYYFNNGQEKPTITFDDKAPIVPKESHTEKAGHCGLSTGKHLWEDIPIEKREAAVQSMIDAGLATAD